MSMTKEQEEAIKDIKIYIHDYISESFGEDGYTLYEIGEEEQEFFNNIETVLNLIKDQTDRINYLESNRKQVKEQVEAAQLELSFAIDMLTDI